MFPATISQHSGRVPPHNGAVGGQPMGSVSPGPPRWHVGEAFANAVLQPMGISWRRQMGMGWIGMVWAKGFFNHVFLSEDGWRNSWPWGWYGPKLALFFKTQNQQVLATPTFSTGYSCFSCNARRKKNRTFPQKRPQFFLMNPRSLGLKPRGKTSHHCGHQPGTSVISVSQDHYILGKSVGTGAFCTVYLASCKKTQNPTAAPRAADRDWTHR